MKQTVLVLLVLCLNSASTTLFAQLSDRDSSEIIFVNPNKDPQYPGGPEEMLKFLQNELNLSKIPSDSISGSRVILEFLVDTVGELYEIKVLKSAGRQVDTEVIRVFEKMPLWVPGENNRKKISVRMRCPVRIDFD